MPATPNVTLTVTLDDIQGDVIGTTSIPAYVEIALVNFGPFLPRIPGTSMLAKTGPYKIPFTGSQLTIDLWSNDQISPTGTYYVISILDDKQNVIQSGAYTFIGTVSTDLSSLAQTFPAVTSSVAGAMVTVPYSAIPTFNAYLIHAPIDFDIMLTGNVTSSSLIGSFPGQIVTFTIAQDGTGNRSFSWPSQVIDPPPINLAPNAVTVATFITRANGNLYLVNPEPASSVPNQDYFLAPFDSATLLSGATGTNPMGTANHARAFQFNLNRTVTFTRISIYVATTSNGNHEYIGIYSGNGQNLLAQAIFTLTGSTGIYTATISQVTLGPGTYWLVRGADQTTSILAGAALGSSNITSLFQGGAIVRYGDMSNIISGGSLPATLGTVTVSSTNPPVVLLEP